MIKKYLITFAVLLFAFSAQAANYNVTWDGGGRTTINNSTCGGTCNPGDTITLPASTTSDMLYIDGINGREGLPITIQNTSGSQTVIDCNYNNTGDDVAGLWFHGCTHIKLTGGNGYTTSNFDVSTAGSYTFGIRVTETNYRGIFINYGSENIEIEYVQVDNIGSGGYGTSGIGIQEATLIGAGASVDDTLYNIHLHHLYIYEITGEGTYIAPSGTCNSTSPYWSGNSQHHIRTDNTGYEGLCQCCCEDASMYNNMITDAGLADYSGVGQGLCLSLNHGFGGSAYNNILINCQKQGIVWQGTEDTDIYNNVIVNTGLMAAAPDYEKVGIDDVGSSSAYLKIRNNTIVNAGDEAIDMETGQTGLALNNLIVNEGDTSTFASLTQTTNATIAIVTTCNFTNAAGYDFSLTSSTPGTILDAGTLSGAPAVDIIGTARPQESGVDIGAYELTDIANPPADILKIKTVGQGGFGAGYGKIQ